MTISLDYHSSPGYGGYYPQPIRWRGGADRDQPPSLVALGLKYAVASLASLTFLLVLIRIIGALLASTEQPAGEAANGVLRALHNLTGLVGRLTRNLTGRTSDLPRGVLHLIEGSPTSLLGFLFLLVLPFLYLVCHFVLLLRIDLRFRW